MSLDRFAPTAASKRPTRSALLLLVAACAMPALCSAQSSADPSPQSLEPPYELVINGVVDSALDDLLIQLRRLPAFAATLSLGVPGANSAPEKKDLVLSPRTVIAVDHSVGKSGQPTVASDVLDSLLMQTARQKLPQFDIVEVSPPVLGRVQYILGGKLTPLDALSTSRGTFRVDLWLTELKTSQIVAQVSVRFTASGVNLKPLWCCITH
jgi:hypothetical protein